MQVKTEEFFLGSSSQFISGSQGNIEISSSEFHLQPDGDVIVRGDLVANSLTTANAIIDENGNATFTSASIGSPTKYLKFDGTNLTAAAGNFSLDSSGNITANGTSHRIGGTITCTVLNATGSGTIGGFSLDANTLTTTAAGIGKAGQDQAFWAGDDTQNSAEFRVNHDGDLVASSATITGEIKATSGFIGGTSTGWDINSGNITSTGGTKKITLDATGGKIYIGTGTYNNDNTPFYADGASQFSLGDALTFDGADLVIEGDITATGGSFTGNVTAGDVTIGTGGITGTGYTINASGVQMSGDSTINMNNVFTVASDGAVKASDLSITGNSSMSGSITWIPLGDEITNELKMVNDTEGNIKITMEGANPSLEVGENSVIGTSHVNLARAANVNACTTTYAVGATVKLGHGFTSRPTAVKDNFGMGTGGVYDNTPWAIMISENYVGINRSATPTYNIHVDGTAGLSTGTAWTNTSDERIKTNIQTITGSIEKINQLRPVSFNYTDDYLTEQPELDASRRYNSFLAQEYAQVFPDAVTTGSNLEKRAKPPEGFHEGVGEVEETLIENLLAYNPTDLNSYLVAAVQELSAELNNLQSQISGSSDFNTLKSAVIGT